MRKLSVPLAVLLLAAFLRIYRLAAIPFGWHPDEATKALLARDVLAGKYFPAFFSAFTGREALFVYLEALLFALVGEGIFAGRLLAAFCGILTVALTYSIGREWFNRRTGVLAAVFLAILLWHLIASRNGYRAVIQPLIQLPVLYLLFRGLRLSGTPTKTISTADKMQSYPAIKTSFPRRLSFLRRRESTDKMQSYPTIKWYFITAGIFLGLTQYTYTAARLFPFLIAAIVILVWLFDRQRALNNLGNLALMALVALLVFLPLGFYFWQNPQDFFGRAAQISVFSPEWAGGDSGARLWQSVKETARMWTVWGDINYRFNISGQPVFGPLSGLLFFSGIALSAWLAIRRRGLQRVVYLTLILWLGLMLLPMVLSAESLPYYQRAIGVLPAVTIFPAITLDTALSWLDPRGNKRRVRLHPAHRGLLGLSTAVLLLFIGWLTITTYQDYFANWHNVPRNDDDRRVAMVYVADYLKENEPGAALYLSTQYMQHPTLALLAPELYDGIHWFDARQSLPLPAAGEEAVYILLTENQPQPWLLDRARGLEHVQTEVDRFGRPVFELYRWSGADYPSPNTGSPVAWSWATSFEPGDPQGLSNPIALPVDFGGVMELLGYEQNQIDITPGSTLELILQWQLEQKPQRQYTIFAHLLAADGEVVAGFDANEYPTSFWREEGGEQLLSYVRLPLETDLPPGEYQLEIGVYNQPTGERLMIRDKGEVVADRLLLAPVTVP